MKTQIMHGAKTVMMRMKIISKVLKNNSMNKSKIGVSDKSTYEKADTDITELFFLTDLKGGF